MEKILHKQFKSKENKFSAVSVSDYSRPETRNKKNSLLNEIEIADANTIAEIIRKGTKNSGISFPTTGSGSKKQDYSRVVSWLVQLSRNRFLKNL